MARPPQKERRLNPLPNPPPKAAKSKAMNLTTVKLSTLVHPPYNPRKAVKRGSPLYNQIKHSLETFGTVQAPVVNRRNNHIVGGNQRVTVLTAMGKKETPVVFVDLDDKQERELNLALNKIGEDNWHANKLAALLTELKDVSDLESIGFDPAALVEILRKGRIQASKDPNAPAPTPPAKPWVKTGDLFELSLGGTSPVHRLLCGDSETTKDMRTLLGDDSAHLIFTDPPYGVAYDNAKRGKPGRIERGTIQNDAEAGEPLRLMLTNMFKAAASVCTPTAPIYTFYASRTHREFEDALNAAGFIVRQQIMWKKHFALSRADYHWAHEPCLYAQQPAGRGTWRGERIETTIWREAEPKFAQLSKAELIAWIEQAHDQSTVWDTARDPNKEYIHPTQKPIALAQRAIKNHLGLREAVLDICGGSGSTMIAAAELERRSFTMEKDPAFAQAILKRFATVYEGAIITQNGKAIPTTKLA